MDDCYATVSAIGYAVGLFGSSTQLVANCYQFGIGRVGCEAIASKNHFLMDKLATAQNLYLHSES